jgi:signal peptidase I
VAAEVLRVSGELFLRAFGASMLPSIWPGDVLTIHTSRTQDLRRGDIVLYARGEGFVIHRVVEAGTDALITRGDACRANDLPVDSSEVLGRVALIRRGRTQFVPKGTLNCLQKLLAIPVRRSRRFKFLLIRLNALRLRRNAGEAAAG